MAYENELVAALAAADLAGVALRELYAKFKAIPDAPASISTDADRASQEIILGHLHRAFPNDALCAEETTDTLAAAAHTGARLWIVDPIDGTRGFARKNGEFSVMVAFVDEGRVAVGAVLEPAVGRLTYATLGGGCWRRDEDGAPPVQCRVTSTAQLQATTLTQSHSRSPGTRSPEVRAINPARVIETYSAGIKLAQVARGEADIYLNTYAAFHDWDIAAGHILVSEAGGKVSGLSGQELRYGLPGAWQRDGLLATNGLVHETAVTALASKVGTGRERLV
jgi:3'(2'), 5'-bisphosphate nucleotidase